MSAPDPVAALREYVRAEGSQRRTGSHAEGALLNEAPRLLAHVERLEAALVRLHEIYAWGVQQNDDDEHETWWKAALECVALGREIAQRRKKGGRDVGTDL